MPVSRLVRSAILSGALAVAGPPALAQHAQQVLQRPATAPTVEAAEQAKAAESTLTLAPCKDLVLLSTPGTAAVQAKLTPAQSATLRQLGADYSRTGDREALLQGWRRFVVSAKPAEESIYELLVSVLRESIQETSEDRERYKKSGSDRTRLFVAKPGAQVSGGAAKGEDCEPAKTSPQNVLQQQPRQDLSEISRTMHDIAISIIR